MGIWNYIRKSRSKKPSPAERNRAFAQAFLDTSERPNARKNAKANPREMFDNVHLSNWNRAEISGVPNNVNNTRVSQRAARTGLMPWRMPTFPRGSRLQRYAASTARRRKSLTPQAQLVWNAMAPSNNVNVNPFYSPPSSVARPEPNVNNPFAPQVNSRPLPVNFDPYAYGTYAPPVPVGPDPFAGGRRTRRKIKARKL
jgi:hypothetical protein